MQRPTIISSPGSQKFTTGTDDHGRQSPIGGQPEDIDTESQPDVLQRSSDSLQNASAGINLLARGDGRDRGHEDLTSTEHSSFTLGDSNGRIGEVGSAESHTGCRISYAHSATDQASGSASRSRGHRHTCFLLAWKWEVLSIITSMGLLAAIIVTLGKFNHKTQPDWPYDIKINTLASLFTTIIIAQLGFILAESTYQAPGLKYDHGFTIYDSSYQPAQVVLVSPAKTAARP